MKKMVMMFAAIAMAIGAQAAEVRWTVLDSNAKGVYNLVSDSDYEAVLDTWNVYFFEVLTTTLEEDSWAEQLAGYQLIPDRFDSNGDGRHILDVAEGDTYLLLLATYDNENFTPGGSFNAYILNSTTESPTFDLSNEPPIYSGKFGGDAIPEPTSGLLLLLGMASLALKRKVA